MKYMESIATKYVTLDKRLRRMSSLTETWSKTNEEMKALREKISSFNKIEKKKLNRALVPFKIALYI